MLTMTQDAATESPPPESTRPLAAGGVPLSVRVTKRCVDVVGSCVALVATAWLLFLIALAIYLDSPGPVLYRQKRAGALRIRRRSGEIEFVEFSMLKFRTMRLDAEKDTGAVLAQEHDPRVTRVGRLLRKTRLDELPQLLNVLRGEMTLVGPRPERPELFSNLILAIPFFEERMRGVKPGITGLAQVSLAYDGGALNGTDIKSFEPDLVNPFDLEGLGESEADHMRIKLLYDLAYVCGLEHFSSFLRNEVAIVIKTPWIMLRCLGR